MYIISRYVELPFLVEQEWLHFKEFDVLDTQNVISLEAFWSKCMKIKH
jgi:hypothetical protein